MENLFVFDLETTGTRHWKNGIHQISGAIVVNGEIVEKFNYKVQPNPQATVDDDALTVGGVSREKIEAYTPMFTVYSKIVRMLAKYVSKYDKTQKFYLVGFNNASFDNAFFRAFFVQNSKTEKEALYGNYFGSWFWSDPWDVMVLASRYLRDVRSQMPDFKLMTVAKYCGIEVDESKLHDAEYDIYLTYEIFKIVTK